MDRFDLERAMLNSRMPALSKALFFVLCAFIDAGAGEILAKHQPSLSRLARAASLCRTSVRNHLYRLEVAGWITSIAPDPDRARREWARTHYVLHVPGSPEHSSARAQQPATQRREARRVRAAAVQERARARKAAAQPADAAGLASPPPGPVSPGRLGGAVAEELARLGHRITPGQGEDIAAAILAGRSIGPGRAEMYVRAAVRKSPTKWAPAPAGPPPPPPRVAQPAPPDLATAGATQARERLANRDRKR